MLVSLRKPTAARIGRFIAEQRALAFSYDEVGATSGALPPGYDRDRVRSQVGRGANCFELAARGLREWVPFRTGWTEIHPPDAALRTGTTVAVLAHAGGLWSLHACRVIEVRDEPAREDSGSADPGGDAAASDRRFAFSYGRLPGHGEFGEERFVVEILPDGSVWYEVAAFFRPADRRVRWLWPLLRRTMNRFRRESAAAMRRYVDAGRHGERGAVNSCG